MSVSRHQPSANCPCGKPVSYEDCCQRYHQGQAAPDAEALMHSRYTAYVLGLEDYLLATWAEENRPQALGLAEDTPSQWLGLKVLSYQLTDASSAEVSFVVRYKVQGKAYRLQERSRFVQRNGRWFYLDGEITS